MTQTEDDSKGGVAKGTIVLITVGIGLFAIAALWFWLRPKPEPGPGATLEIPSAVAPKATHSPPPPRDPFVASPAPLGK